VKLDGPDFFTWKGLRRVRQDGLVRRAGHYYDQGAPVLGCLIPHLVDRLLEDGLCELGDPDESGMRPVALTEAGWAHYRMLCRRQRREDLVVPPPEHGRTRAQDGIFRVRDPG
jgi:hypothetical protein